MEKVFNQVFFYQMFSYSVLMCLIGYQLIDVSLSKPYFLFVKVSTVSFNKRCLQILGQKNMDELIPVLFNIGYLISILSALFANCYGAEKLRSQVFTSFIQLLLQAKVKLNWLINFYTQRVLKFSTPLAMLIGLNYVQNKPSS